MTPNPDTIIAGLDIGASKVTCLIASRVDGAQIKVEGVGQCACTGVVGGNIRNLNAVEQAIRTAVGKAEKMARTTVSSVYVSMSGGSPKSQIIEEEQELSVREITQADMDLVTEKARAKVQEEEGRIILHMLPVAYALDGEYSDTPPVGLYGKSLGISIHVISVDEGPYKNLQSAVRRAQLDVDGVVLSSYASALAIMVDEERQIGAACVDMGAGVMGLSLFALGSAVYLQHIDSGTHIMTERIMRELLTSRDAAEGLKTRSGSAICEAQDANLQIDVPRIGEGDIETIEVRSTLTSVMQEEYESLLVRLNDVLTASGFTNVVGQRVILTGGGAQATRLQDLATKLLERDVRIGEPEGITGLPENARSPAFACAIGLIKFGANPPKDLDRRTRHRQKRDGGGGPFYKLFQWMRETL